MLTLAALWGAAPMTPGRTGAGCQAQASESLPLQGPRVRAAAAVRREGSRRLRRALRGRARILLLRQGLSGSTSSLGLREGAGELSFLLGQTWQEQERKRLG